MANETVTRPSRKVVRDNAGDIRMIQIPDATNLRIDTSEDGRSMAIAFTNEIGQNELFIVTVRKDASLRIETR